MKKRIITLVLTLVFTFGLMSVAAAADAVRLQFNGKILSVDVPPVIKSGRTLVPVRVISETMGADVQWDSLDRTVTILKNNDTVFLTIDSSEVKKNGMALNKLDVPAQIINGKTMVPVRFVSEALGAQVNWDKATATVQITFEEKRAGLTPEEMLEKSTVAMMVYDTYKFKATGAVSAVMTGMPAANSKISMEGQFKKPAEVFVKEIISTPQENITVEVFTVNGAVYTRIGDEEWRSINIGLPTETLNQLQKQDPAAAVEQMKEFGLVVAYGNEIKLDGKDYYVIYVKFDEQKYKALMQEVFDKIELPQGAGMSPDQVGMDKKIIQEMVSGMKVDLSYKGYINKDTMLMDKIKYAGTMDMGLEGKTIKTIMDIDMSIYDFGAAVTMPDITK